MIRQPQIYSRVIHQQRQQILTQHRRNQMIEQAIRLKKRSIERIQNQLPQSSRKPTYIQNSGYFKDLQKSKKQASPSPSPLKGSKIAQSQAITFLVNYNQQNTIVAPLRSQLKFYLGESISYDRLDQVKFVNKQTIEIRQPGKNSTLTFNSGQEASFFVKHFHLNYKKHKNRSSNPFASEFKRPIINPQMSRNLIDGQYLKKGIQCLKYKSYLFKNTQPKKLYVTADGSSVYLSIPDKNVIDKLMKIADIKQIKKDRSNQIFRKQDSKKTSQQVEELVQRSLQIIGTRIFALEFRTQEQRQRVFIYLTIYQKLNKFII